MSGKWPAVVTDLQWNTQCIKTKCIIPQNARIHLAAVPMEIKDARKVLSIDSQIALSEAENLPCYGKDLCYVTRDEHVDYKIKLILLNSVLMTRSPIWGRQGKLVAKTKKDSTSMRDVSLMELEQIFFDDDFFSSQIWLEL